MNNSRPCALVEKEIEEFSILIQKDESEQDFQNFFENNLSFFNALGFSNAIPHPIIESPSQGKYIPDFIVCRNDNHPSVTILPVRKKFSTEGCAPDTPLNC